MDSKDERARAFDDFIDSKRYDEVTTAIWDLVKVAYYDAWEKGTASSDKKDRE